MGERGQAHRGRLRGAGGDRHTAVPAARTPAAPSAARRRTGTGEARRVRPVPGRRGGARPGQGPSAALPRRRRFRSSVTTRPGHAPGKEAARAPARHRRLGPGGDHRAARGSPARPRRPESGADHRPALRARFARPPPGARSAGCARGWPAGRIIDRPGGVFLPRERAGRPVCDVSRPTGSVPRPTGSVPRTHRLRSGRPRSGSARPRSGTVGPGSGASSPADARAAGVRAVAGGAARIGAGESARPPAGGR
jgi:hypothetical protein